ncbi:MAG: hypothetical protein JOZ48_20520 [Acidobacteriaceae bacterium]|nr:hypothetical protein [Acidobacteriaceae bacterium]
MSEGKKVLIEKKEFTGVRRFVSGCILFCVLFTGYALTRRPTFHLTLEMSSSVPSIAQLFYDIGSGYTETDSKTVPVINSSEGLPEKLVFDLPEANILHLRFDPITSEGTVTLRRVRIDGPQGTVLLIQASEIVPFNQIQSRIERNGEVTFSTVAGANDPGVTFILREPFEYHRESERWTVRLVVIGNVLIIGTTFLLLLILNSTSLGVAAIRNVVKQAHSVCGSVGNRLSIGNFIRFDAWSIWFYLFCGTLFVISFSADVSGSSAAIYSTLTEVKDTPLLGSPRLIRADEYAVITPAILNEALRLNRFQASHSYLGDHSVALFGNLPVYHISTLFRPQFWPFFVLPLDYAYAWYWQFKTLFLLGGSFTFLLLITRSTFWAISGSLWYFFSPFTQWTYSWPSALPEMVGLMCLTVVLACLLTVATSRLLICAAAVAMASCAINFVMCGYLPHLVPLVLVALFFVGFWCIAEREVIFRREMSGRRIVGLVGALALVASIGFILFLDTAQAIRGVAGTAYPGHRSFSGANTLIQMLGSHFLEWTENETHVPPALGNICEAAGFLWLAPATLFISRPLVLSRMQKFALGSLWCSFAVILVWMLLPVPAALGKILGLNLTGWTRCLPALGLANISIVALCMSANQTNRFEKARGFFEVHFLIRLAGIFTIFLTIILLTNQALSTYFSWKEVLFGVFSATMLVILMLESRARLLAATLIIPQAFLFGGVNPIERGLSSFTSSELYRFVRSHTELLKGRWLVYSEREMPSGYLAAMGCDVYTGVKYLPDIDHFQLFASKGLSVADINRIGIVFARAAEANIPSSVETPLPFVIRWKVSPSDPLLRDLGIRYFAFDQKPPETIAVPLLPMTKNPVSGLWLYRLR